MRSDRKDFRLNLHAIQAWKSEERERERERFHAISLDLCIVARRKRFILEGVTILFMWFQATWDFWDWWTETLGLGIWVISVVDSCWKKQPFVGWSCRTMVLAWLPKCSHRWRWWDVNPTIFWWSVDLTRKWVWKLQGMYLDSRSDFFCMLMSFFCVVLCSATFSHFMFVVAFRLSHVSLEKAHISTYSNMVRRKYTFSIS